MTTIRVRAIPVGAALQLTRRALELGPHFTYAGALELLAEWWTRPWPAGLDGDLAHPFTFALSILETSS